MLPCATRGAVRRWRTGRVKEGLCSGIAGYEGVEGEDDVLSRVVRAVEERLVKVKVVVVVSGYVVRLMAFVVVKDQGGSGGAEPCGAPNFECRSFLICPELAAEDGIYSSTL